MTKLTIISLIVLGTLCLPTAVLAREENVKDTNIIKNAEQLAEPERIVITPIFAPTSDFSVNEDEWYRGLFYYSIERLGFSDIPFHYVVTNLGTVYKGNSLGEEQRIPLTGSSNTIVIGYFAARSDNEINPRAYSGLGNLIVEVANRQAVKLENITISRITFTKDDEKKLVLMELKELPGLWTNSLNTIVNQIRPRYSPQGKNYSFEVSNVVLPPAELKQGETATVSLTVKNTGSHTVFQGSGSEIYASKVSGGKSRFYINGSDSWAGQTEAFLMPANSTLKPGESKTFSFKLGYPLYFGQQSERFALRSGRGTAFSNNSFDVTVNVARPSSRVVEILATEIGYLRVRESASSSGAEIARVGQGERFLVLQDLGNGWIKLDLGNGRSGWVSNRYTRNV